MAAHSQTDTRVKIYAPIPDAVLQELSCGVGALLRELGIAVCKRFSEPLVSKGALFCGLPGMESPLFG
jgi:hypothetical protein